MIDPKDIKDEVLGYYIGLLGSPFSKKKWDAYQALRFAVPHRISGNARVDLTKPVTME